MECYLVLCLIVCHVYKYRLTDSSTNTTSQGLNEVVTIVNKVKNSIKKNKQKNGNQKSNSKSAKGSLGRSLLAGGLGSLGGLLGPAGARVGASLGDWGANILGMGDYEVKQNTLLEGNGVPKVHATRKGVVISHREFLGDITGSTAFTSRTYTLNPGSSNTFPWLSNIAGMFQSYKFKGLIFEFNSTSADALNSVNTALGTVILATQYNVALPQFVNKAEMEQYEYSVSGRPSRNLTHCVECDPSLQVMEHLFTRTGSIAAGQDYQFYDWGNFQIATVGMQAAATIGELWVSYEVEFLKPRIPSGGTWPGDFTRISNGPYTAANNPLGTLQTTPVGNLGVTIAAGATGWQRIQFPNRISAGRFHVTVTWIGAVAAAIVLPIPILSNLTLQNFLSLGAFGQYASPLDGVNSTRLIYEAIVTVNGYSDAGSYMDFPVIGTLPATPTSVDIVVIALPLSDSPF